MADDAVRIADVLAAHRPEMVSHATGSRPALMWSWQCSCGGWAGEVYDVGNRGESETAWRAVERHQAEQVVAATGLVGADTAGNPRDSGPDHGEVQR